jgi:hypothetical protein
MKKLIVVSATIAVVLLIGSSFILCHAQEAAKEEKSTFYHLVPGTYVNGWPRFTITYPKDWVELTPQPQEVFRAADPNPTHGEIFLVAHPWTTPQPLDKLADGLLSFFKVIAKDVTVVTDKPYRLRDGTPAREVELQMVLNGLPANHLSLATKKDNMVFSTGVSSGRGRIREDLKAILYSLESQPGKDEPVKVPADIQEFFDKLNNDTVSHDFAKSMTHYSDRYLNSGVRKGELERWRRQWIGSVTSVKVVITDFVPSGDRAYLTGFVIFTPFGTFPITDTSIIKENGEWKWYGNQRDVTP